MGAELLQSMLIWVQAHPLAAGFAIFAAAVAESLFLFGLLVPGALLMFIAGALVGADALPMLSTFLLAIAGAIVGDSASFALGYAYRGNLHRIRLLKRTPRLLTRGEDFLSRHGGKSIILGRFVGPLRPVMPTVTGAAGMSPWRFLGIDIIAALGWAPCYILPGVLFGASLDLAAQVAGRLALLLLLVSAVIWFLVWAIRWLLVVGSAWGRRYAERLLAWSRRHRRLGLLGPALADPQQPEIPALALVAALLLLITWGAYSLVWGFSTEGYPQPTDALVYHIFQGLRTPGSDFIALVLAQLSTPGIYLPLAAAAGITLLVLTSKREAIHWLAALSFAAILVISLQWLMTIPTPQAYFAGTTPATGFAGGNILISGVIYGFLAIVLATPRPFRKRQNYYSVFTTLIVLIAFSRLYLGLDWLSDILISLPIAFVWVALLTLGYRRRWARWFPPQPLFVLVLGAVSVAIAWQALGLAQNQDETNRATVPNASPETRVANWYRSGYTQLPTHIHDLVGRQSDPLNVQASGTLESLRSKLTQAGWQIPVSATVIQSLIWLAPDKPIAELPVLPRIHDGQNPDLTMTLPIDAHDQWILRLWRSEYSAAGGGAGLWLGQATQQTIAPRLRLLRLPADETVYLPALTALGNSLRTQGVRIVHLPDQDGRDKQSAAILLWDAASTRGNDRISPEFPAPRDKSQNEPTPSPAH